MLSFVAANGCASTAADIRPAEQTDRLEPVVRPDNQRTYAPLQVIEVPPLPEVEPLIYEARPPFVAQSLPIPVSAPRGELNVNVSSRPSEGYRIQIYAGRDKAIAKRIEASALGRVAYPVYLNYEAPQYKVRLGNFASRDHATIECERLKQEGFPEAWVVRTTILVQR